MHSHIVIKEINLPVGVIREESSEEIRFVPVMALKQPVFGIIKGLKNVVKMHVKTNR